MRAPNADLARDPRWGRTEEVYGEDPFLVGTLATAFTRGLQGDDPRYWKTAALLKHFLANSNEDGARVARPRTSTSGSWREYYAKPFEMAVARGRRARDDGRLQRGQRHARPRPPHAARHRGEGMGAGRHPLHRRRRPAAAGERSQGVPRPARRAAAACIKAGINHFLDRHKEPVTEALARGLITEADIDQALRGLFRVSIRLGLLDPPERVPYSAIGAPGDPEPWSQPETRALVREVTRKSIVLLKNSAGLLPLDRAQGASRSPSSGPLANQVLLDWYSGTPPYTVSPREGIERAADSGAAGPRAPSA